MNAPEFAAADAAGNPLSRESLAGRKAVLIFLRHLGCPVCRMEIAELRRRGAEFAAAGAEVVVFVDSPEASVKAFVAETKPPFRLVADPEHRVYRAFGLARGGLREFTAPGAALRTLKATLRGHLHGKFEGDELQVPGDFVLAADGGVAFAHRGAHIGDNTPLDVLLAAVKGEAPPPAPGLSRRALLVAGAAGAAFAGAGGAAAVYNHRVDAIGAYDPAETEALYAGQTTLLFQRYPGLRGKLPWLPLGVYPTPVELLCGGEDAVEGRLPPEFLAGGKARLYVKRDDLTNPVYGGNKVRKLEHVLAEAKLAGRTSLLTVGGLGSNQCLATSIHGGRAGFAVDIALFDQPVTPHVIENLLADREAGANFVYGGGFVRTAYRAAARYAAREKPYYIPTGATTPLGDMGYVNAALELAAQVQAGILPEPDRLYVAAGSCGTSAGLIAGCKLAGLKTRVVAVQITEAIVANRYTIAANANAALAALRALDPAVPGVSVARDDFDVESAFFGPGYGAVTPEGQAAVESVRPALTLETTYTGKTLAACLDYCRRDTQGAVVLFWNTFNSARVAQAPGVEALPADVQAAIRGA
jgi:D-cysteine desulfhydrase